MSDTVVDDIANAVLYEGYLLYPYRASAVKNRQRWNFGVLYPEGHGESSMQTEVLVQAANDAYLMARVRFLHLLARDESWQEAIEREIVLPSIRLTGAPLRQTFAFPAGSETDGGVVRRREVVEGAVEVQVTDATQHGLFKVRIRILNETSFGPTDANRDDILLRSMVSTHTILTVGDGEFVSLLDPPEELREMASTCRNVGTWPVLVGNEGQSDAMLSSPIILYDYPQIAPESPGALFDGTEIDEILTLRIMTLTDEEKHEMSQADERAREILERTESMRAEQLMKMHGVLRGLKIP